MVAGARVALIPPCHFILFYAYLLIESYSYNIVRYNALIIGLQFAEEIRTKSMFKIVIAVI